MKRNIFTRFSAALILSLVLLLPACGSQPVPQETLPAPAEETVLIPAPEHYFGMAATSVDGDYYTFNDIPENPWNAFACYVRLLADQYGLMLDATFINEGSLYTATLLHPDNSAFKANLTCSKIEENCYTVGTWFYGPIRFENLEVLPSPVPVMTGPAKDQLPEIAPLSESEPEPESEPIPEPAPGAAPSVLPDFLKTGTDYEVSDSTTTYWKIYTAEYMDLSAAKTYVQQLKDMGYTVVYSENDSDYLGDYLLWELAHSDLDVDTIGSHGAHVIVEASNYAPGEFQEVDIEFSHDLTMDGESSLPSEPSSGGSYVDCPSCYGGDCTACGGRGGKDSYSPGLPREWDECWKCYGDGKCDKCNGHGWILG